MPLRPSFARWLLATLAGSVLFLAAPPFSLWPLALVGLALLAWVVHDRPPLVAAALVAWAGTLFYFFAFPWWPETLERFAGLEQRWGFLLTLGFAISQALPLTLTAGIARQLQVGRRLDPLWTAPLCLVAAESWLPPVYKAHLALVVWQVPPLVQWAEMGGTSAVSGLVLALALFATTAVGDIRRRCFRRKTWTAGALLMGLMFLSLMRMAHLDHGRTQAPMLKVGLLQPNFGIVSMEDRKRQGHLMIRHLQDAAQTFGPEVDLIILPESTWPFLLDADLTHEFPSAHPWHLPRPPAGRVLWGALTHPFHGRAVFNSAVLTGQDGKIAGRHDKTLLVPFAETDHGGLNTVAHWLGAQPPPGPKIKRGRSPVVLRDGSLKIGPMICLEDLDAAQASRLVTEGAQLLVALANDAWFGDSSAPLQHFALASFRAVETRRDLVRVANHGISGHVDALGRTTLRTTLAPRPPARPTTAVTDVHLLDIPAIPAFVRTLFPGLGCLLILLAVARAGPGQES